MSGRGPTYVVSLPFVGRGAEFIAGFNRPPGCGLNGSLVTVGRAGLVFWGDRSTPGFRPGLPSFVRLRRTLATHPLGCDGWSWGCRFPVFKCRAGARPMWYRCAFASRGAAYVIRYG